MEKKKILIVDDDKDFASIAKLNLEDLGKYKVRVETKGAQALSAASQFKPDVIILDLMLPDMGGLEICKRLKEKERFSSTPIIMLSGKKEEADKVSGLDTGADDYVVKPFSVKELDARIRALLRRAGSEAEEKEIDIGRGVVIYPQRYEVTVKGEKAELTHAEFAILQLLVSRKGQVFTRSRILDYLWDTPDGVTERTIDVHITHLREKLGKAGSLIKNVRGVGYKLDDETEEDD
jgi:DNA-binding response OmpR family regulator